MTLTNFFKQEKSSLFWEDKFLLGYIVEAQHFLIDGIITKYLLHKEFKTTKKKVIITFIKEQE